MQQKSLDIAGHILAWLVAALAVGLAITNLWLARHQPIEMDLAMMHYCAFLINEKGLLLYRDIFENNLPGPFFFHAMIGKAFGYGSHAVRVLDTGILLVIAWASWKILQPVSRVSAILAPALFTCLYFAGGPVAAFQRDYIAIVPLALTFVILVNPVTSGIRTAVLTGALSGIACSFKPNFIVVAPAFLWLLTQHEQGSRMFAAMRLAIPFSGGFLVMFSIPFLWALRHGDLAELVTLYKTYTPVYVSTRTDLYHYESREQQLQQLLVMQIQHLGKLSLFALPGMLWAWCQQRNNPQALQRLRQLALVTFAIAWHEVIAGKYWFAHLLPPYFFVVLCFSLLLTPATKESGMTGKSIRILLLAGVAYGTYFLGAFSTQQLYNKHYDADNHDIRSKKIARYLQQHLQPGEKVQALDGSGDGQASLLLAGATTATRFVEDIPLYLQPDAPATRGFRREFLTALAANPPAYIVYIHNFFHPAGGNRLQEFRELDAFIRRQYEVTETEDGEYTIYRRKQ